MSETAEYIARIHESDDGFWAEVIDLPGCFASGRTLDELREALEEAISLCRSAHPDPAPHTSSGAAAPSKPHPMRIGEMRVSVPA